MNSPASAETLQREYEADGRASARSSMFCLTRFAEIDPSPRKTWLVDRLLGAGELSAVFGAPGSGKSVLVSDMACHIAGGRTWLMRTVAPGAVLYVAAERAALVKRRMAAWRIYHGVGDCQEFCARGHDDGKRRIITWLSRRTSWISFWRVVIRTRCSPRTACWMI
jgi:hypothetical protein